MMMKNLKPLHPTLQDLEFNTVILVHIHQNKTEELKGKFSILRPVQLFSTLPHYPTNFGLMLFKQPCTLSTLCSYLFLLIYLIFNSFFKNHQITSFSKPLVIYAIHSYDLISPTNLFPDQLNAFFLVTICLIKASAFTHPQIKYISLDMSFFTSPYFYSKVLDGQSSLQQSLASFLIKP